MARWSYPVPGSYWVNAEAGFTALHGYLVSLIGHNLHPDAPFWLTRRRLEGCGFGHLSIFSTT